MHVAFIVHPFNMECTDMPVFDNVHGSVLRLKYLPYAKFLVLTLPDGSMFIPNVNRIIFSV